MRVQMDTVPANVARAMFALLAIMMMGAGALLMWGFGAALFSVGLFFALDCSLDEMTERFTRIKRVST